MRRCGDKIYEYDCVCIHWLKTLDTKTIQNVLMSIVAMFIVYCFKFTGSSSFLYPARKKVTVKTL